MGRRLHQTADLGIAASAATTLSFKRESIMPVYPANAPAQREQAEFTLHFLVVDAAPLSLRP
jgi:hypothetical protein